MSEDIVLPYVLIDPPAPDRNAPCPCGSGVKYKKCHLIKDDSGESCGNEFWEGE